MVSKMWAHIFFSSRKPVRQPLTFLRRIRPTQREHLLFKPAHIWLMALLCRPDLAVTDRMPLFYFFPSHTPCFLPNSRLRNQNSRKQHRTGRTIGRQRMEGYQVRMKTGASSPDFPLTPLSTFCKFRKWKKK